MGPCTKGDREKCLASNHESFLEMICKTKNAGNPCVKYEYEPHPYVGILHQIYVMQAGGYMFDPDTFNIQGWMDIGVFHIKMENKKFSPINPEGSGRHKPPRAPRSKTRL